MLKHLLNFNINVRDNDVDAAVATDVLNGKMGYEKHFKPTGSHLMRGPLS